MQIREDIIEISRMLYNKGFVNAFEGNVSVREGNRIYITPSAVCKGFLTQDQLLVTDMEGHILEGNLKPSSEIKLHLAIYRERADVSSVVHAHTPFATAFAVANKPIETFAYPEMIVLFGKIPLAPYGTPSTDEIWKGLVQYIYEYDVVLLSNHGMVSAGKDVRDAYFKLESAESVAKVLFLAEQLGGEVPLPTHKLEELYQMRKAAGKKG